MSEAPKNFVEFWPHYVRAHSRPLTRLLHFTGTVAGWGLVGAAILLRNPWLVLAALLVGYALAWISHFFIEHNRPATLGHPLWSWLSDQKMVWLMLTGRMGEEVRRAMQSAESR